MYIDTSFILSWLNSLALCINSTEFCFGYEVVLTNINICLDFKLSLWNEYSFLVLWFLYGVRSEFLHDISGAAVGPIFSAHESDRK